MFTGLISLPNRSPVRAAEQSTNIEIDTHLSGSKRSDGQHDSSHKQFCCVYFINVVMESSYSKIQLRCDVFNVWIAQFYFPKAFVTPLILLSALFLIPSCSIPVIVTF